MADNTVTLVLDGEVPLQEFSKAIVAFNELVKALSVEAGGGLDWVMQDLQVSSALASALAIGEEPKIEAVVTSYETVAQALEENTEIPYSEPVRVAANKIVSIEDHRIKAVRFETAKRESTVHLAPIAPIKAGDVQMVSAARPQSKRFTSKLSARAVIPAYGLFREESKPCPVAARCALLFMICCMTKRYRAIWPRKSVTDPGLVGFSGDCRGNCFA